MSHKPFDSRRHQRETLRRLILGGFAVLVVIGDGLILVIYGPGAAMAGFACIGGGVGLFALVWGILQLMDRWSRDLE